MPFPIFDCAAGRDRDRPYTRRHHLEWQRWARKARSTAKRLEIQSTGAVDKAVENARPMLLRARKVLNSLVTAQILGKFRLLIFLVFSVR